MRENIRILKIGGSVITDKSEGAFEKLKQNAVKDVCRAISENWDNLVVVHGAGSFGHPHVRKYGLDPLGASKVHLACVRLSELFCSALSDLGVPAMPIHPMNFCTFGLECDVIIKKVLKYGFLPVLHGDVVLGRRGVEVLSGDDIVLYLAEKLRAYSIGFATDVDGVLINGRVVRRLSAEMVDEIGEEGDGKVDVTGGMLKKIRKIFCMRYKCKVFVFRGNYINISKFLNGEKVGTEVML